MTQSPLVWDRVAANRRATVAALVLFALPLAPFLFYIAHQTMAMFAFAGMLLVMSNPMGAPEEVPVALLLWGAGILALVFLVLVAVGVARGSAALVRASAGARPLGDEEDLELRRAVENMAIAAGLPQPKIARLPSDGVNAMALGLDPEHATLAITTGAVEKLDARELEALVAHLMARVGQNDIRTQTVLAAVVSFLWFPWLFVRVVVRALHTASPALGALARLGAAGLAGLILLISLSAGLFLFSMPGELGVRLLFALLGFAPAIALLGVPLWGLLMARLLARTREDLADAQAVLLTRHPEALARALTKIATDDLALVDVNPAIAPLFVANPAGQDQLPGWHPLCTHPPLADRIEAIRRGGDVPPSVLEEAAAAAQSAALGGSA